MNPEFAPSSEQRQEQHVGDIRVDGKGHTITFSQTQIIQISVDEVKTRPLKTTSPYKSLKKFELEDKDRFFGRDQFLAQLTHQLEQTNLILLMGASGSGKSSIIRAGLIPWLSQTWGNQLVELVFTPDQNPFDSLYASLLSHYKQTEVKDARLCESKTLTQVVTKLKKMDEFWFIFIDQFEELFTTPINQRQAFIDGLIQLKRRLDHVGDRTVKILATMRADFLDRLSPYAALVRATDLHRPMLAEMQPDELRLAIEQPAAHHGVVFEEGLVQQIIKDVQGQAGYLPLLQYTLNLLWETEVKTGSIQDRTLNIQTYNNLGGVRGALQQHVDAFYEQLSGLEQQAVQRIFLKLVEIGGDEELGTEWRPVRRRALLSEFKPEEQNILTELINQNLLVSGRQPEATEATIDIAHEILLTSWSMLNRWIVAHRQIIAIRNRLYEDVARWQKTKPDEELWRGSKLARALELKGDDTFNQVLGGFTPVAQTFITASQNLRERQRRRILLGLSGFSAITLLLAGLAGWQWRQSVRQSILILIESTDARVQSHQQFEALLVAIKASKQAKKLQQTDLLPLAQGALLHSYYDGTQERIRLIHRSSINSVVFSPDSKQVVTASDDETAQIWDSNTGSVLKTLKGHQGNIYSVVFSPDGKEVVTTLSDEIAQIWDSGTGKLLATLKGHQGHIFDVIFSPDGKQVATASEEQTTRIWDSRTGRLLATLQHQGFVHSVVFSPDSKQVATASEEQAARIWDSRTGKLLANLRHQGLVNSVAFSPDGKQVATASDDGTARIWDSRTGRLLRTLRGHQGLVLGVVFSPDGKQVATDSADETAKIWDSSTGKLLANLRHQDFIKNIVFSPDGKQVATILEDETVGIWDSHTGKLLRILRGHQDSVYSVVFSPDGKQVATASEDKTARIWDSGTGKLLRTLEGHQDSVFNVVFSPDGKQVATISEDGTARIWDSGTSSVLRTLRGHQDSVYSVVFSPDGKQVATASEDKTAKIWDSSTGKLLRTLRGHQDSVFDVVFSSDGKQVATTSGWTAKIWDSHTGKLLRSLQHQGNIYSVVFSPDGKQVATASADKTARIWDSGTGKLLRTLQHQSFVNSAVFSPDSKQVATASRDSTARIWDSSTGKLLAALEGDYSSVNSSVNSVVFSPDGKQVVTASFWVVQVWDSRTNALIANLGGHRGRILSVVFSPDGKQVATASADKTAKIWDSGTGKLLRTLQHQSFVNSVVFSPDGKQVFTASGWTVGVWDSGTGKLLATLRHQGSINSMAFSSDGKQIATVSEKQTIQIWRVGGLEELLVDSCEWVQTYLQNHDAPVSESDRHLCDNILSKR